MKKLTACFVIIIGLLTGCSTTSPLVDWNRRIGHYSYNLALTDLGVPERSTTLSDGSIVADWMTQHGTAGDYSPGGYVAQVSPEGPVRDYGHQGYATQVSMEGPFENATAPTPNQYLRLTFGPDGQLTSWTRYQHLAE